MFFSILLLLLHPSSLTAAQIDTWDLRLSYDIDGKLSAFTLPLKLSNPLPSGAYLQIGGVPLHSISVNHLSHFYTQISEVKADLKALDGTPYLLAAPASLLTQLSFPTHYYFRLTLPIPQDHWLLLTLYPTKVESAFYYDPLILRTLSSLEDSALVFDANYAAGLLNVAELPPSGMTITSSVDSLRYPNYLQPGASYVVTLDLTTRVQVDGVAILLAITSDNNDAIPNEDFQFVPGACSAPFSRYTCSINGQTLEIRTDDSLLVNQITRISFGVQNPAYSITKDLKVATIAINQGNRMMERGKRGSVFMVNAVDSLTNKIEYLWGLDQQEDLINTSIGLFYAEDTTVANAPYNSVKITFTVSASINLIFPLIVKVRVAADTTVAPRFIPYGLAASTKHNFQSYDEANPVYCSFQDPFIQCFNVGTLTSQQTYFISTKIMYKRTGIATEVQNFGQVSFQLQQSLTLNPKTVYATSNGFNVQLIQDHHMLDIGGWHGPNGFLSYTQVSSIDGDTLTTSDLNKLFSATGTVGIVPSTTTSSLLFFLKTNTNQFCGANALASDPCFTVNNKYLKMTVLLNSQVFTSDSFNIPSKLNYIANDGGGVYVEDNFQCVNGAFCDIGEQNSYAIYSGTNTNYGVAQFECGKTPGTASLLTDCFLFKGTTGTAGSNGIIALPKITYSPTFTHNSFFADEQTIDFVINFYRGDIIGGAKPAVYTRVSTHLINAYTVNKVQSPLVSFVNFYMGPTKGNDGYRIPTMIRIKMPVISEVYSRIQVFFDKNIKIFNTKDYLANSKCYSYDASAAPGPMDIWYLQSSIVCDAIQDLLLPVVPLGIPKTIYVTLFSDQKPPIRVHRVYGAAVSSEVRKAIQPIGGLAVQAADLSLPYTKPAQSFDFALNLNSITTPIPTIQFSTSLSSIDLERNLNNFVGAGLTIISIGQDIFQNSELTDYFGSLKCLETFNYRTYATTVQDANANIERFVKFCPFDRAVQYPIKGVAKSLFLWPMNFKLQTILSYSLSGANGQLYAARLDTGIVNRLLYSCTLGPTNSLFPNSLGLQRVRFPVRMSSEFEIGGSSYASFQVRISLNNNVNGFNLITSTTICMVEFTITLSCSYTVLLNDITATITSPSGGIKITKGSVIIVSFKLRSTYGLNTFGANQPFTVRIRLPSMDASISQLMLYGAEYDPTSTNIQEQCSYSGLKLEGTSLGSDFKLWDLKIKVPNLNAIGDVSWQFQLGSYRDFVAMDTSFIRFNIGFLRHNNMEPNALKCQVIDTGKNQISQLFSKINVAAIPYIDLHFLQDVENLHTYAFQIVCRNFKTPGNLYQTEAFTGALVDFVGFTQVYKSDVIPYGSLTYQPQSGVIVGQEEAKLLEKQLNSPGFGSIYKIQIQNGKLQMLKTFKIYLQFHQGISTKKHRISDISCRLNTTFCYCEQKDDLIVMDSCLELVPKQRAIISVSNIDQPARAFWPTATTVWLAVDSDSDPTNGLYFQSSFLDNLSDEYQIQGLEVVDTVISSNFIRTIQTHKLTINFPSGSIVDQNRLYIQLPAFYADQLEQVTSVACNLGRADDVAKTNFATTCDLAGGTTIQMVLQGDSANNLIKQYTLTLGNIPLPQLVMDGPLNQYQIGVHIVQSGYTRVKVTSGFYFKPALSLTREEKIDLLYEGFHYRTNRDESITYTKQPQIIAYKGVYRTLIRVKGSNDKIFSQTFGFEIQHLKSFPTFLQANSGASSFEFLIGAPTTLPIGYTPFKVNKLSGGSDYMGYLRDFQAFVVEEQCQLTTDQAVYQLTIGGLSQPIVIDVQDCYPMADLRILLVSSRSELHVQSINPQNIVFDSSPVFALRFRRYQFIFQVANNDTTTVNLGDELEMEFLISGVSSKYYTPPKNIKMKFVDQSSTPLSLTFSQVPTPNKNSITFYLSCSISSTLIWVIGGGEDIEYIPQQELLNRTLYENHMRTQLNSSDTSWKLYGANSIVNPGDTVIERFNGLKSYTNYSLLAFCIDLIGFTSDQLLYHWQTVFNGGTMIKLNVTFNDTLSEAKELELVCGLNLLFPINPLRIYNSKSYSCTLETMTLIRTLSSSATSGRMLQQKKATPKSYFVYLQPDYSLREENINKQVQESLNNLTQFIANLHTAMSIDFEVDPTIVNVIYSEPDQSLTPQLNYTKPLVGSTTIEMNFTLLQAPGYLGVGLEQTDTSNAPSITQLRRAQNFLNRNLVAGQLLFLEASQVQNQTKKIQFMNLLPNLKYKIYFFTSNDDAGPLQLSSNVTVIQVQTSPSLQYSWISIQITCFVIYVIIV